MGGRLLRVIALAAFVLGALWLPPAYGAFPGKNGRIALSVFTGGPTEIYSIQPDGTGLTQLTQLNGTSLGPAWSADGKKIAFAVQGDIWTMNADGSSQLNLTQTPWEEDKPAWSPDGQRLAFSTARAEDGSREIYTMNADGSGQANLTRSPDAHEEHPAWSPDASRIAFSTFFGIHTIRADGTDHGQLTSNPIGDREPDWSPDGSRIAFTSVSFELGENDEVDTIAADGTDRMQITHTAQGEAWPKWSPDGTKILFHGSDGIQTINPDGTQRAALGINASFPDWQPLPPPERPDYKTASAYCDALQKFLGDPDFKQRYKNHGRCVSANH
jgi:Tol biopolymer transport system component